MTTFYAHYDIATGKLLAVGGHKLPDDFPGAGIVEMPEELAMKFLTQQYNPAGWGYGQKHGEEAQFHSDMSAFVPHNMNETVEVKEDANAYPMGLEIKLWVTARVVEFSIPDKMAGNKPAHIQDETLNFVFVKKDDPLVIYAEFAVPTETLFTAGSYAVDHEFQNLDFSVFTKRVFNLARIIPMMGINAERRRTHETRIETLAVFKNGFVENGIQATQIGNKLTLERVGGSSFDWPFSTDECKVFVTKPHDPTILYEVLSFSVMAFLMNEKVTLELSEDLPQKFSLASYPLAPSMAFIKGEAS